MKPWVCGIFVLLLAAPAAAADAQGVKINQGDVVLFHTGWQKQAESAPGKFLAGEPGLGLDGARHLVNKGVVAVGSDGWALEVLPNPDKTLAFPVHAHLLAKSGVHILENIQTAELAADGVHEFMFVLGVPRFEGAVQMVINPVAIRRRAAETRVHSCIPTSTSKSRLPNWRARCRSCASLPFRTRPWTSTTKS